MSRIGRYRISSDDSSTPAALASTGVLAANQGGTGLDTSAETGQPWLVAGVWDIGDGWINANHPSFADVPAALTAAAAGGYDLYFPKGTYTIAGGSEWTWPDGVNAFFDDATISYTLALATAGSAITLGSNIHWYGNLTIVASNTGETQEGTGVYAQNESNIAIDFLRVEGLPMGLELTNCANVHVKRVEGDAIKGKYTGYTFAANPKGSVVALLACNHIDIESIYGTDVWKAGIYLAPTTRLDGSSASLANTANTYVHVGALDLTMDAASQVANGVGLGSGQYITMDSVQITDGLYGIYIGSNDDAAFAAHPAISHVQFGKCTLVDQDATADGKGVYIRDDIRYAVDGIQFDSVYAEGSGEEGVYVQRFAGTGGAGLKNIQFGKIHTKSTVGQGVFVDGQASEQVSGIQIGSIRVESNGNGVNGADAGVEFTECADVDVGSIHLYDIAGHGVRIGANAARVRVREVHAENIAQETAANDNVVSVTFTARDCEIGSIWAQTTSGNQHGSCITIANLSDFACRVTGNTYSTGGSSADHTSIGGNAITSIKNGEFIDADIPTAGTWQQGKKVWEKDAASGATPGWVCTTSGTFSAYAATATTTNGSNILTSVSTVAGLLVGQYVSVDAGFATTGPFLVTAVGTTTVTLDTNSNGDGNLRNVTTPDPVFKAMANLA